MVFLLFDNSGSIYPKLETTTQPSTTTTSTEKNDEQKESKENKKAVDTSAGMDENRKKSLLTAEMRGFLDIITKFTDLESLPKDPEIDEMTFRIRAVSCHIISLEIG